MKRQEIANAAKGCLWIERRIKYAVIDFDLITTKLHVTPAGLDMLRGAFAAAWKGHRSRGHRRMIYNNIGGYITVPLTSADAFLASVLNVLLEHTEVRGER